MKVHCDKWRELAVIKDQFIHVDEDQLDIFSVTSKVVPFWSPTFKPKKFREHRVVGLDIETTRLIDNNTILSARKGRIMAIGIINEEGRKVFIRRNSERNMLLDLFNILNKKQPEILLTYNGMNFDIPFIVERCRILGIRCPFSVGKDKKFFKIAAIAGVPWMGEYTPTYIKFNGKHCDHIDLMQQAIAYDAIFRKATSYSLKKFPVDMGWKEPDDRIELTIEQLEECYRKSNWDLLLDYLGDDLDDTMLVADKIMPSILYQMVYFPGFSLQQIALAGNGTKWVNAIYSHYDRNYTDSLPRQYKLGYKGALTVAEAGVFFDVVSFDFSGQYPNCQIQYGLCPQFDYENWMLARLTNAVEFRKSVKYKENPTDEDEALATAAKAPINSAYGACAAIDPIAAALITAAARARLKFSIAVVEELGGKVVLSDTDSVYIIAIDTTVHHRLPIDKVTLSKLPSDASDALLSAVAIGCELRNRIPEHATLDLDSINRVFFVPPVTVKSDYNKSYKFGSKNGRKFIYKCFAGSEIIDVIEKWIIDRYGDRQVIYEILKEASDVFGLGFPNYQGVRKNYIKQTWNNKKQCYELKAKGKFTKRNRTILDKTFQKTYLDLYVKEPGRAYQYYQDIMSQILSGTYPIENLKVTRRINVNDKKLVRCGLGEVRDMISFHIGVNGDPVLTGDYSIREYATKLRRMHDELVNMLDRQDVKVQSSKQLSII